MSIAIDSFSYALDAISRYPKILLPLIVPFAVNLFMVAAKLGVIGSLTSSLISFIAFAVIVQCLMFIVEEKPVSLKYAWKIVYGRLDDIIITSLLATLLALTVILIPAALFTIVIAVIDKEKPVRSILKSFMFIINNLKEVVVLMLIAIILAALTAALGAIIPWFGMIIYYAFSLLASTMVCLAMAVLYCFRTKGLTAKK